MKLRSAAILFIFITTLAAAQPHNETQRPLKVPEKIQAAFSRDYPRAEVASWGTEGDYYKVIFNDANLQQVILYDTTGKVFRKETELDDKQVPPGINRYYRDKYPNEQARVWRIEDRNNTKSYCCSRHGQVIYFDSEGNYSHSKKTPAHSLKSKK